MITALTSVWLAAMPAYLRPMPWTCKDNPPGTANGFVVETLQECRPNGKKPELKQWIQRLADAMGEAGLQPRLRFGPLGPHLYGVDRGAIVSATFVTTERGPFDVWISVQRMGAQGFVPELPPGATLLGDQAQADGQRVLSIHLERSSLLDATLTAVGALPIARIDTESGGKAGRMKWNGRMGSYALEGDMLTLYQGVSR